MSADSRTSVSDDSETVTSEKAQLESLVVDQQLALYKATELYSEYQISELEDTSKDRAVVPVNEKLACVVTEIEPAGLEMYQETSLEKVYTSSAESERVAAVLKIAAPFADELMKQWTVMDRPEALFGSRSNLAVQNPSSKVKPSLRRIASQPNRPEPVNSKSVHFNARSSGYKNPSVESDSEDEDLRSHGSQASQTISF